MPVVKIIRKACDGIYYTVYIFHEYHEKYIVADSNPKLFTHHLMPRSDNKCYKPIPLLPKLFSFHQDILTTLFFTRLYEGKWESAVDTSTVTKATVCSIYSFLYPHTAAADITIMQARISKTVKLMSDICDVVMFAPITDEIGKFQIPVVNLSVDCHSLFLDDYHPWDVECVMGHGYEPIPKMNNERPIAVLKTGSNICDLTITDITSRQPLSYCGDFERCISYQSAMTKCPAIIIRITDVYDCVPTFVDYFKEENSSWRNFARVFANVLGPFAGVYILTQKSVNEDITCLYELSG